MTRMHAVQHICVLLHDFSAGGSERIAIRLANAWAREGRQVSILCGSVEGPLRTLVAGAINVVMTPREIPRGLGSRYRLAVAFSRRLNTLRPDLVFVPGNFHVLLIPATLMQRRRLRPAVVVKLSNPLRRGDRRGGRRWFYEALLRRLLHAADAIVAMSPGLLAEARAVLRQCEIVSIAQPTLSDAATYHRIDGPAATTLLAASRLVGQKNMRMAVEAFAELDEPTLSLVILGEGPQRQALRALASELGVAHRVSFPGYVDDILPWLERSRILLLPSLYEGYPAVAVEALSTGVPVVATACSPAIPEIISHPDFGRICGTSTPAAMAAAIRQLIDNPPADPARLSASVAHHRMRPIALQYLALFDRIGQHRRGMA